jgi:isopenicillin N synthase-like dioxygenase
MNVSRFGSHGLVTVPYPYYLQTQLELAVRYWQEFCSLPVEVKKSVPYSNDSAGFGYEQKTGSGPNGDQKENFDVTDSAYNHVITSPEVYSHPTVPLFVINAFALIRHLRDEITAFAKELEREFGLAGLVQEVSKEDAYFVRFIHYFGNRQVGDELANAHVDQSGLTFHLYESAEGFQYLPYRRKRWVDKEFGSNQTLIIPNMQMQLRSEGRIRGLCHRVVATDSTVSSGRFSAVCFVMFRNTAQYDKAKYGRLQEREAGFNYNMPFEEFHKLFKT